MPEIKYVPTDDFYIEKHTLKKPQAALHYHHAYELYYILDGEREYFLKDLFFKVTKGDIVWVPQNMLHRTDGKGATRFLLFFKDDFIKKYFSSQCVERLVRKDAFVFRAEQSHSAELNNIFYAMLKEFNRGKQTGDQSDEFLLAKYLFDLLFFISTNENIYTNVTNTSGERIHLITKYINENYPYISGMQEVAEKFNMGKTYFCNTFTNTMGVSFVTYLNTIRIKAACDMIKNDRYTLSEIAMKCGFCSQHYFCRVFKLEKGMTPSEYREQFKTKKNAFISMDLASENNHNNVQKNN